MLGVPSSLPELPHTDPLLSSWYNCVTATNILAIPTLIEEREALTWLSKNASEVEDSGKVTTRSLSTPLAPGYLQLRQPIPMKRLHDPFKNIQQNLSHVLSASSPPLIQQTPTTPFPSKPFRQDPHTWFPPPAKPSFQNTLIPCKFPALQPPPKLIYCYWMNVERRTHPQQTIHNTLSHPLTHPVLYPQSISHQVSKWLSVPLPQSTAIAHRSPTSYDYQVLLERSSVTTQEHQM